MIALLQGAFALLARQMGRILNTAFGWATAMLFGKVPSNRQSILSIIALVAVLWLLVLVGVVFPSVGTFLLAFVPLPDWVDPNWVRLGMLIAAAILPAITGGLTLLLMEPDDRPSSAMGYVKVVLRGYPYTLGLALAILAMIFVAPLMKARDLMRGWTNRHVPVVVEADDYFEVVDHLQQILDRAGFRTERHHASVLLRWPTRLFAWLAGSSVDTLVARELQTLRSDELEVLLHPSDLVIHADEPIAARVFAQVNEHLAFSKAFLSWTKEGQEIEEGLRQISRQLADKGTPVATSQLRSRLTELRKRLEGLNLEAEEWEILFREVLMAEQLLSGRVLSDSKKGLAALTQPNDRLSARDAPAEDFEEAHEESLGNASGLKLASIAGAALAVGTVMWRQWRARHNGQY
jgi:cytochrome c biogenesis protein CcdA